MGWAALVQVPDAVGEVARRTIDGRVVSRIASARQGLRYSQLPKHAVHMFPFHRVRHAPHQIPRLGPREVQRRDPPNGNNQPLVVMWECWRHWGEAGAFSWGSLFMVTCVCACPGASYLGRIGLRGILAMARTHFTILICSRAEWILLRVIPIRRLHQLLIRNPGL